MRDLLFPVEHDSETGLQTQLRRQLVDAILDGRLSAEDPLPSCRRLAQALGISRNTVVLAYQALAGEGLLISRERIGYFVNAELAMEQAASERVVHEAPPEGQSLDWRRRFRVRPSEQLRIQKPKAWRRYPYPFIYGQADPSLFPVAAWRSCSRQALGVQAIERWTEDSFGDDDPMLVEEVRTRVLPRRGITAAADEILITLGGQNALYIIARLLAGPGTTIGVEDPGYVDVRNIMRLSGAEVLPLAVDAEGVVIDEALARCAGVYVTPSHQSPTTVTLPRRRRLALLEAAARHDFFVIEDDYEAETNFLSSPTTALKSLDERHAVIYVGSFSKHLAPGLRIGYLVAQRDLVAEARILRGLILRHPPSNNQRTVATFISEGYHDALVHRLQRVFCERWEAMREALARHLPEYTTAPSFGGTSFWLRGPDDLDSERLARDALDSGIVIEPGAVHFQAAAPPRNYFRLGFSSIPTARIAPGIELLASLIHARGSRRRALVKGDRP